MKSTDERRIRVLEFGIDVIAAHSDVMVGCSVAPRGGTLGKSVET